MGETTTRLMTVEEFRQLPETGPFYYELRHGEIVQVTRPKEKHHTLQRRLRRLLEGPATDAGVVDTEWAFRALSEHELRVADVAFVSTRRLQEADPEDNLRGAPELVIEVLSPSNTATEILDKEKLCLDNGCLEFWVVDPVRHLVRITTSDGFTKTYQETDEIPLRLFSGTLSVKSIFAD
ncbi:MAG TPA: Uma2 family endonuclease [Bryobacteraceae bacterium]|nr:Uma2 family endonuclease [Bryobacteraceae bacterium]